MTRGFYAPLCKVRSIEDWNVLISGRKGESDKRNDNISGMLKILEGAKTIAYLTSESERVKLSYWVRQ